MSRPRPKDCISLTMTIELTEEMVAEAVAAGDLPTNPGIKDIVSMLVKQGKQDMKESPPEEHTWVSVAVAYGGVKAGHTFQCKGEKRV